MKDTFTLWGVQDSFTNEFLAFERTRQTARWHIAGPSKRVVKLECRIALPVEIYPADFERAFAESKLDAKDKDAAFQLWKGGAR